MLSISNMCTLYPFGILNPMGYASGRLSSITITRVVSGIILSFQKYSCDPLHDLRNRKTQIMDAKMTNKV